MSRVNMIIEHQFYRWAQKNNPSPAAMITAREGRIVTAREGRIVTAREEAKSGVKLV